MAAGKVRSAVRYLLLCGLSAVGIIVIVEVAAWLLGPSRYQNPPAVTADAWIHSDALAATDTLWLKEFVNEFCLSYNARWTPYVYFQRVPFAGRHINVDSSGRRFTPQFHAPGTRSEKEIFLFGGSTMWGTGARDSGTIPSALARLLAADPTLPPAEVVNMGESGYVSTQEVIALELELRKGNIPDFVVFYDGTNDVFSAYQNGEAGWPQNEMHRAAEFNLLRDGGRMRSLGVTDLLKRTLTAELLDSLKNALRSPPPPPAPDLRHARNIVRTYAGNLGIVEALSRHYGFKYLAYWQPVVFSKADRSAYEQRQSDLWGYVRPLFIETRRELAADSLLISDAHFCDLGSVLDGFPAYLDFCHISERGNARVAERMYTDLRPLLFPSP